MTEKLKISPGNAKLRNIPNTSTLPGPGRGATCGDNAKHCIKGCYAAKFVRIYANVADAWGHNTRIVQECERTGDWNSYIADVTEYLFLHPAERFRWHVSGDFASPEHLQAAFEVASMTPDTRHLAYTKRDELLPLYEQVKESVPNFTLRISQWPGLNYTLIAPVSSFWLSTDERVPATAVVCPGDCGPCDACWSRSVVDVVNHPH